MRTMIKATAAPAIVAGVLAAVAATADDRVPLQMPADMQEAFLGEMRHHMDSFDDVIVELAAGDFKAAAQRANEQLVPGSGKGFGRFLPVEFREMGLAMHRAAAEFAAVADAVPAEPTAADWKRTVVALQAISAQCRACHAYYRLQ